jgi:hypothetical protein
MHEGGYQSEKPQRKAPEKKMATNLQHIHGGNSCNVEFDGRAAVRAPLCASLDSGGNFNV